MGRCFRSADGRYGLLYQCVKEGGTILQLVCPNNFACSANTARGSCQERTLRSGVCVFSTTTRRYTRIRCDSQQSIPTFSAGRLLRHDFDEHLNSTEYDQAWEVPEIEADLEAE